MNRAKVEAVAAVLKKRFPNLKVEETIGIAFDILEALGER